MTNDVLDKFAATVKFGTVSASRPGFARVRLPDLDNMRTMWLPIAYPKTLDDQVCWTYDIGQQVACVLDARGEDGFIAGAIYSDADTPPTTDPNKFMVRFKDGALIAYDRASHVLTVSGGVVKVIVEVGAEICLKSGTKVTLDTPDVECSGNMLVKGKLTYQGGMAGSGGDGGASAEIEGGISVNGNVTASGTMMDGGGNSNHHTH